jgi:predicted Zn-dependent protease with MMP-like domain
MTRDDFERVVDRTLEELTDDIASQVDNLVVVVEDRPSKDQDPHGDGLLGLYEGISLADRGIDYFGVLPDQISIFMNAHRALGLSRVETEAEVRKTVLHEIGHHLGLDEARLHELGWG